MPDAPRPSRGPRAFELSSRFSFRTRLRHRASRTATPQSARTHIRCGCPRQGRQAVDVSYKFGDFHLDPAERLLLRHGQVVSLTPKAFDLLVHLVEHHGQLVEKSTLIAALWPDTIVEEGNLAFQISEREIALHTSCRTDRPPTRRRQSGRLMVSASRSIRTQQTGTTTSESPTPRADQRLGSRTALRIRTFRSGRATVSGCTTRAA